MKQFILKNRHLALTCLDYGAIMQKLIVKDKSGNDVNVIMGFKEPEDYLDNPYYIGATIGRCAGRISKEGLTLNGINYPLYTENDVHLHGGKESFAKKIWQVDEITEGESPSIKFSYLSKHLEEGYPGNLEASVTYKLEGSTLIITFEAVSDHDTVVNLTNHNYYNLKGSGNILDHELKLKAKSFIELDDKLTPTGKLLPVKDTPYDFSAITRVGNEGEFKGIDDYFILDEKGYFGEILSPETGIRMKMSTNQPAVVIYTPPQLPEANYNAKLVPAYSSICFETESFPYAPQHKNFPLPVLRKDEKYFNQSFFEFSTGE